MDWNGTVHIVHVGRILQVFANAVILYTDEQMHTDVLTYTVDTHLSKYLPYKKEFGRLSAP